MKESGPLASLVADGALIGCRGPILASWRFNAWRDCYFDDGFQRRMSSQGKIRQELRSVLFPA
jgi:hypothetical protein